MIPYILHVSLLIAIVISLYKLFLEKETHYRLNRWVLSGAIFSAFILPLLTVPASWSLDLFPDSTDSQENGKIYTERSFDDPVDQNQPMMDEVDNPVVLADEGTVFSPEEGKNTPLLTEEQSTNAFWLFAKQLSVYQWLGIVYGLGVLFFIFRLIIQMGVLIRQIKILPKKREGRYVLLEPRDEKASYSFFHYIFINPIPLDRVTYRQILSHEKIHADQKHSIDILLAELLLICQWFNPFAWAYRKSIRQNIEYLTDDEMVKNGADLTDYQMSLLRVSVPEYGYSVVANYNQSLLKKRILMMNAKKSSLLAGWKYFFLVALLGLSLPLFNAKAEALVLDNFPEINLQSGPILLDQNEAEEPDSEAVVTTEIEDDEPFEAEITQPDVTPQQFLLMDETDGTWEAILKDGELCLRIIRSLSEEKWN